MPRLMNWSPSYAWGLWLLAFFILMCKYKFILYKLGFSWQNFAETLQNPQSPGGQIPFFTCLSYSFCMDEKSSERGWVLPGVQHLLDLGAQGEDLCFSAHHKRQMEQRTGPPKPCSLDFAIQRFFTLFWNYNTQLLFSFWEIPFTFSFCSSVPNLVALQKLNVEKFQVGKL